MSNHDQTHRETWDDSELVNSWNDALDEYKKYHSIAARGENIDDLITQFNNGEMAGKTPPQTQRPAANDDEDEYMPEAAILPSKVPIQDVGSSTNHVKVHHAIQSQPTPPQDVPQALLASVQDENIRNLMMSWYYAGYYTGFFEGQQKAHSDINAADDTRG
ncbi:hypothetical protein KVT40_001076 [Elsinoe batatas]|uniref:Survival motor neuron Tudor domain-containing protein n=1 Tax=Elsinoe batatas TaxID=2601811 RepID=A0A8K0PJ90_9PEZI|nr:hypothetical protein KVT40_001076 [Elsinoe batatas]